MLRFLAPYSIALVVAAVAAMVGYSTGMTNATGLYGILSIGLLIFGIGAARWEGRDLPPEERGWRRAKTPRRS
jgi:hypothetical protein